MKKIHLLASAVLGLALSAQAAATTTTTTTAAPAKTTTTTTTISSSSTTPNPLPLGINAIGYDGNLGHVTARLGLSDNNSIDVGLGLNINSGAAVDKFQTGVSGLYLLKLQDWGMVDNYLVAGGWLTIFSDSDLKLTAFAGMQPEITLLDRIIVSIRFGFEVPVIKDFGVETVGDPISIVNGLNFKVIW